jgi:hypothetical protein
MLWKEQVNRLVLPIRQTIAVENYLTLGELALFLTQPAPDFLGQAPLVTFLHGNTD